MKFISQKTYKNHFSVRILIKGLFIIISISILPIFYPQTAHAGLFSFFKDIGADKVSAKTIDQGPIANSQNMSLLQAVINSDPNPNTVITDGPLALGNALVAEIGPSGTVSEVDSQNPTEISIYKVRSGDTLSGIGKMFGVSTNTIIWANELGKNPVIQEGQTLIILPISGIKYTVKKGDTIRGIVLRYKVDLDEVLQHNDLTLASTIVPGDIILIPDAEPTIIDTPKIASSKNNITNPAHDFNGPYYPGYYIRPVDGGIKTQGLHGYNAVDLASPIDTPIHASAAGTVIASLSNGAWNGGYGNYVIISHDNGTYTLYAHTHKNFVKVGDHVEQGQMIAKVGMTGKTTGPHVHFEIRGARNPF